MWGVTRWNRQLALPVVTVVMMTKIFASKESLHICERGTGSKAPLKHKRLEWGTIRLGANLLTWGGPELALFQLWGQQHESLRPAAEML